MTSPPNRLRDAPTYKWIVIGLLFLTSLIHIADRTVISAVLPLIGKDLQVGETLLGWMGTAFLLVYAICSPFAGYLGDRCSRRAVVAGSLLTWSLVTLLTGFVSAPWQMIVMRGILGVTMAFCIPASMAILADFHGRGTRGKAVAILSIGASLGSIVGGPAASAIGEAFEWNVAFLTFGTVGVLFFPVLLTLLRNAETAPVDEVRTNRSSEAPRLGATLATLLRTPTFLCLGVVSGITSLAVLTLFYWLPFHLNERFGMSLTGASFFGFLALTAPVLFGSVLGGSLSDRLGVEKPGNRLLLFAFMLSFSIPAALWFSWAGEVASVLVAVACFKLARTLGESNWHPIMYDVVAPHMRSTATGVTNAFNCAMGGLGTWLIGFLAEKNLLDLQGAIGLVSVLLGAAVLILVLARAVFLENDLARNAEGAA